MAQGGDVCHSNSMEIGQANSQTRKHSIDTGQFCNVDLNFFPARADRARSDSFELSNANDGFITVRNQKSNKAKSVDPLVTRKGLTLMTASSFF